MPRQTAKSTCRRVRELPYLEQNLPLDSGETAIQIVIAGDEILAKALAERDNPNADPAHAGEIEEIIMSREGYRAESEAARLLAGLGLPDEVHNIPANKLSGGQLMRALLARSLFAKGEVLLLDEPTNRLDMPGIKLARKLHSQRSSRARCS